MNTSGGSAGSGRLLGLMIGIAVMLIIGGVVVLRKRSVPEPVRRVRASAQLPGRSGPEVHRAGNEAVVRTAQPVAGRSGRSRSREPVADDSRQPEEGPKVTVCPTSRIGSDGAAVGITDTTTGESTIIKLGQFTPDGFRLVAVDRGTHTVEFEKNGRTFVTPLNVPAAGGASRGVSSSPGDSVQVAGGGTVSMLSAKRTSAPKATEPFRPVTLQTTVGTAVNISPVRDNANLVQLDAAGQTYVLPRDLAEAMINDNEMTVDQRANALLTSPDLAEVQPGQDVSAVGEAAREAPAQPPAIPPNVAIPPLPAGPPPGL